MYDNLEIIYCVHTWSTAVHRPPSIDDRSSAVDYVWTPIGARLINPRTPEVVPVLVNVTREIL